MVIKPVEIVDLKEVAITKGLKSINITIFLH